MFAGLDDVDWDETEHPHVPEVLRGMVSEDAGVREDAYYEMWAEIHHQGDVYGSTLAALPFIREIVATPGLPERAAAVALLAGITGHANAMNPADATDTAGAPSTAVVTGVANTAAAMDSGVNGSAVADVRELFEGLLEDADVEVRRVVPRALLAGRERVRSMAVLKERLPREPDAEAAANIVRAVGVIDPAAAEWLLERVRHEDGRAEIRLAAIAALAEAAPERLPADVVPAMLRLKTPAVSSKELSDALGERVADRTALLIGLLRAEGRADDQADDRADNRADDQADDRDDDRADNQADNLAMNRAENRDAIRAAQELIENWRGEYAELVALIGDKLDDPDRREDAATALADLGELAAPAADALARHVHHSEKAVKALAALRDPRVVPRLRELLERPEPPDELGRWIGACRAAELVPGILRRFDEGRRGLLVLALGQIGPPAIEAAERIAALVPDLTAVEALAGIGATDTLRGLCEDGRPAVERTAAEGLLATDPERALAVLRRHLTDDGKWTVLGAVKSLAIKGQTADPVRLRELLTHEMMQVRAYAAIALANAGDDSGREALREAWQERQMLREHLAGTLRALGEHDLLAEEAARARRATSVDGMRSPTQVTDDLRLLRMLT